jgi:hypothetical protein
MAFQFAFGLAEIGKFGQTSRWNASFARVCTTKWSSVGDT